MTNKQQAAALTVELGHDGYWWVDNHIPPIGPYDTKKEAEETRRRVRKFYLHEAPICIELDLLDDILR